MGTNAHFVRGATPVKLAKLKDEIPYRTKNPPVMRRGKRGQPHSLGVRPLQAYTLCLDNGGSPAQATTLS